MFIDKIFLLDFEDIRTIISFPQQGHSHTNVLNGEMENKDIFNIT